MRASRLLVAVVLQAATLGGAAAAAGSVQGGGRGVALLPIVRPASPSVGDRVAFGDDDDDDDDGPPPPLDGDDVDDTNITTTERGMLLGSPCDFTCNPKLHHVYCDPTSGYCECEKKYPVKLGATKGCAKPKTLGEQCFYRQACKHADAHSSCVQINHNAVCQCDSGYHSVSYSKPYRRVFCTEDLALLTSDVPTLLGVCSGIALLAGLLCLVLHLYTRGRTYTRPHHFGDAGLPPPMFFASETGIPLAVHSGRTASRSSIRSSYGGSLNSASNGRRGLAAASRAGAARAAAILLISCRQQAPTNPPPAAGSRRSSLASLQSTSSSVRSYSMKRFEKEREQKEKRQQMQMRLAQLHANMAGEPKTAPTPSPRTPNSTDGLLPAVTEGRELSFSQTGLNKCTSSSLEGIMGPCSSSGTSY